MRVLSDAEQFAAMDDTSDWATPAKMAEMAELDRAAAQRMQQEAGCN